MADDGNRLARRFAEEPPCLSLVQADPRAYLHLMPKRRTPRPYINAGFPTLVASLTANSLRTIALRTAMMASGTCSPAEYRRMVSEKAAAVRQSTALLAAWPPVSATALLAPWHRKAKANAKRLGRRR